jgi:hypothetical protein
MAIIIPANSAADTGYSIDNSCRMTRSSSTKFERTISTDGTDPKKWTLNYWMKRGSVNASESMAMLFNKNSGGTRVGNAGELNANNKLYFYNYDGSGEPSTITSAILRDPSAWYNIHLIWDTANATAGDRMRTFINGTEVTAFDTDTNPPLNEESMLFEGSQCTKLSIGYHPYNNSMYFDGYIAQVIACDGQAYLPTKFGEFNEDSPTIWQPIDPSGESLSFGTHGFWLDFKDSSALGNDVSGNNNDFTPANLAAADQCTDTPTNNFCTLNPLWYGGTLSEGNTVLATSATGHTAQGTMGMTAGKWYWEIKVSDSSGTFGVCENGISPIGDLDDNYPNYVVTNGGSTTWTAYNNPTSGGNSSTFTDTAVSANDIIGVAYDADNAALYVALNNDWMNSGDPTSGASATGAIVSSITIRNGGTIMPVQGSATGSSRTFSYNFGNPSYANSSDAADANGYGKFEYSPPSGYLALCTKNLGSDGG